MTINFYKKIHTFIKVKPMPLKSTKRRLKTKRGGTKRKQASKRQHKCQHKCQHKRQQANKRQQTKKNIRLFFV